MLSFYMEEPGMVSSDWLRKNEGLSPAQIKQLEGLGQLRGVEVERLNGVEIEQLNGTLGLIPDWQFYPQPPPIGTGTFSQVTVDLPGACPSYGISGAMGLGANGLPDAVIVPATRPLGLSDRQWVILLTVAAIHGMLRLPLAIVDGIHGYKRNDGDVLSGVTWGVLGLLAPLTTTGVAVAQGYGEEK